MSTNRAEWIGMLTTMCAVLGGLLALTVTTQARVSVAVPDVRTGSDLAQEWENLQNKILVLQNELNARRGHPNPASEQGQLAMLAAVLPVHGPGIQVTLNDNPHLSGEKLNSSDPLVSSGQLSGGIIHDIDILRVVNELFAGGAEAIAINGQRIGPRTAIRCVGPAVNINQVPTAPPFRIEAIGDPDTLQGALRLPGGVIQELNGVDAVVAIEPKKSLSLSGFDGAIHFRFAQQGGESRKEQTRP